MQIAAPPAQGLHTKAGVAFARFNDMLPPSFLLTATPLVRKHNRTPMPLEPLYSEESPRECFTIWTQESQTGGLAPSGALVYADGALA